MRHSGLPQLGSRNQDLIRAGKDLRSAMSAERLNKSDMSGTKLGTCSEFPRSRANRRGLVVQDLVGPTALDDALAVDPERPVHDGGDIDAHWSAHPDPMIEVRVVHAGADDEVRLRPRGHGGPDVFVLSGHLQIVLDE